MCDSSCNSRSCVWLEVLIGVIFGVLAVLTFLCLPGLFVSYAVFLMFSLAVLTLIAITCILCRALHETGSKHSCLCSCGKPIIIAAFGTLVLGLILMTLCFESIIFNAILFGLMVAFFAAMLTGIFLMYLCILTQLCRRHRPCRECDDDDDYRR